MKYDKAGAVIAMAQDRGLLGPEGAWVAAGAYRRELSRMLTWGPKPLEPVELDLVSVVVPGAWGLDRRFILGEVLIIYGCPSEVLGPFLLKATGSEVFYRRLQVEAVAYGYYLRQTGLFDAETHGRVDDNTELDILMHIGVGWYDPHDREGFPQ